MIVARQMNQSSAHSPPTLFKRLLALCESRRTWAFASHRIASAPPQPAQAWRFGRQDDCLFIPYINCDMNASLAGVLQREKS